MLPCLLFLLVSIAGFDRCCFADDTQANAISIKDRIIVARSLQAEASALGFEWSTIEPLIQNAESALHQRDFERAAQSADEAIQHSKLAIEQAHQAETDWRINLPPD